MQLALIAPVKLLEEVPNTNYHLVLAHLLHQSQEYKTFYQTVEGFKILDNGAAEGSVVSPDLLIEAAYDIGADEVVVPDVMGDFRATQQNAIAFEELAANNNKFKFVGVVQGKNAAELLACARAFAALGYFDTLAIPRHVASLHPHERYFLADCFRQMDELGELSIDIHCLGANSNMKEPAMLAPLRNIRGMDTSLPIYMALLGFDLRTQIDYYRRPPNYFSLQIEDPIQKELVDVNIRTYASWASASLSQL